MDLMAHDPEVFRAIHEEEARQEHNIELIASENIVSPAVRAAQGSVLTNKYSEGYPGHRYYGGNQYIDVVENLAIERAKKLLVLNLPMFSRILVRRQTWRHIGRFLKTAIRFWPWT